MSVREYIGARYVPMFADPIEWDDTLTYEPLTVVKYQGASYVSRREVPEGIALDNEDYWILWADFNAQLQQYINIVNGFDNRIEALEDCIPVTSFDSTDTVDARFDALEALLPISDFDSTNTVDARFDTIEGKFPIGANDIDSNAVTSSKLASSSVTTAKINDGAVTTDKIANNSVTYSKVGPGVMYRDYLAVVGDSFSDEASEWPTKVRQNMGFKGLINKSVAGSGFIRAGYKNFVTQFNEILADSNFDRVTDIVIYGGVNDYVHTSQSLQDYTAAFNSIWSAYSALTNKPRLYMIFGNCHSNPEKSALSGYAAFCDEVTTYLQSIGFVTVDNAKYWLLFETNSVDSGDGIHPNATGRNIITGYMSQVLEGTYTGVVKRHKYTSLSNLSGTGFIDFEFNNGTISFYCALNSTYINNCTSIFTPILNLSNLYSEIGPVASYSGAYNRLESNNLRLMGVGTYDGTTIIVELKMAYDFTNKQFGIWIGGVGTEVAKLSVCEDKNWLNSSNQLKINNAFFRGAGN